MDNKLVKCYSNTKITTDIRMRTKFYAAHEEHQEYLMKNPTVKYIYMHVPVSVYVFLYACNRLWVNVSTLSHVAPLILVIQQGYCNHKIKFSIWPDLAVYEANLRAKMEGSDNDVFVFS